MPLVQLHSHVRHSADATCEAYLMSTLCTPVHKQGAPTTCLICKREEGQECLYATLRHGQPKP